MTGDTAVPTAAPHPTPLRLNPSSRTSPPSPVADADGVEESFFARGAEEVAPDLLGWEIESTVGGMRTAGRIVEVEAYVGPHDPASHAAARIGRTSRNQAMFGPPGTAYVYLIYGMHWCLNVVTSDDGFPAAVLVRALEPVAGLGMMTHRRGRASDLCSGPGRLCQALAITGGLDGHDLAEAPLKVSPRSPVAPDGIERSRRIGVTRGMEHELRFYVRGNPHVSRTHTQPRAGAPE